ncbi:MAG: HpcH/HpaI aldolase/citrate lyase family protein [Paracoccaceae bacterium]
MNGFKQAIAERRLQIGFWQSLGTAITAEISAYAGFDWLLIDGEHGVNDIRSIRDQLQVISPGPSEAVVRIPSVDVVAVKQVMDAGAQTILVPIVNTPDEAELMVRAMRYAPEGIRGNGAGVVRASDYGRDEGYLRRANADACLLVQIETREALGNLRAICALRGVDGVFIGPADLATSMGHIGDTEHPEVQAAIETAIKRIRASGKAPGILMGDETRARRYIELGAVFVAVGSDVAILAQGSKALAAKYRAQASDN